MDGSTHPCKTEQCAGGVARNIAEALWRLRNGRTRLLTAIGNDEDGRYLKNIAPGLILNGCTIENARTAKYAALFDINGDCKLGLGDMDIHNHISITHVNKHIDVLKAAPLVVIDGNVPTCTMDYVLKLCNEYDKPVFFEPTDRRKAIKPLLCNKNITYASPNIMELKAMANFLEPNIKSNKGTDLDEIIELSKIVLKSVKFLIITRGPAGVVTVKHLSNNKTQNQLEIRVYSAKILNNIENASGAGDCFSSGFIHGILERRRESQNISLAFQAAQDALLSKSTVPIKFNVPESIDEAKFSLIVI